MLSENDVLKSIIKHKKPNGNTDYSDVMNELSIDDVSLMTFVKVLKQKGYITTTMEDITITPLGLSAYKEIKPIRKARKSIYNLSKFTLQRLIDILIGIVIGIVVSYITYHFGWN